MNFFKFLHYKKLPTAYIILVIQINFCIFCKFFLFQRQLAAKGTFIMILEGKAGQHQQKWHIRTKT